VPVGVVHVLEPVEVQEEDGDAALDAAEAVDFLVKPLREDQTVRQARERVAADETLGLLLAEGEIPGKAADVDDKEHQEGQPDHRPGQEDRHEPSAHLVAGTLGDPGQERAVCAGGILHDQEGLVVRTTERDPDILDPEPIRHPLCVRSKGLDLAPERRGDSLGAHRRTLSTQFRHRIERLSPRAQRLGAGRLGSCLESPELRGRVGENLRQPAAELRLLTFHGAFIRAVSRRLDGDEDAGEGQREQDRHRPSEPEQMTPVSGVLQKGQARHALSTGPQDSQPLSRRGLDNRLQELVSGS
jgi:hypothetical protein